MGQHWKFVSSLDDNQRDSSLLSNLPFSWLIHKLDSDFHGSSIFPFPVSVDLLCLFHFFLSVLFILSFQVSKFPLKCIAES